MILKSSHSKYQLLNKIRYGLFVWEPRGGRFCAFLGLVLLENGVESVPGSRGLAQQPDFCFLAWGALLFINQGQKKKINRAITSCFWHNKSCLKHTLKARRGIKAASWLALCSELFVLEVLCSLRGRAQHLGVGWKAELWKWQLY